MIILPFPLIIHSIMSETKKGDSETSEKMLIQAEIGLCGCSVGCGPVTPHPPKRGVPPGFGGMVETVGGVSRGETGLFPTSWSMRAGAERPRSPFPGGCESLSCDASRDVKHRPGNTRNGDVRNG